MTPVPPRVLHVIEGLGLGGAERLLLTLLPELNGLGFAPEVAVLAGPLDLAGPLQSAGVPVHALGLHCLRHPIAGTRRLRDLIRDRGASLVHTHLAHANLYGRMGARLAGIPAVTTYHDTDYEPEVLVANPHMRAWKQQVYRTADRLSGGGLARVIAVSEYVKESVVRRLGFDPSLVQVIYNGVAESALAPVAAGARAARRQELGLSPTAPVVVQVGRLTPQKGQRHALGAAKALRDVPGLLWLLVGDGPCRADLESILRRDSLEDRVRLMGPHADVRPILEAADIFAFPSLHEGLGIAALEAMAAGLPVVAYRTGPLPEVVVAGVTGVLVPRGDVQALADAVGSLVRDPARARALGQAGRSVVASRFRITDASRQHAALYAGVLARSPS